MSLPLTIIGGYLGAGKTTLLNRILTGDHGRRIAVIVNDFGALNVDVSMIANHDGETIALTNGCVCCSAVDGTTEALARLLRRAEAFDRIVIEASGVAEPGKVARNAAAFRVLLDGVIVLVDAEQLPEQSANRYVGRSVLAQLRQADLIVLNKVDLAGPVRLAETRALIARHAVGTQVLETEHARLPHEVVFGVRSDTSSTDPFPVLMGADHHASQYRTELNEHDPMSRAEFDRMVRTQLATAVRAKGHVALTDAPDVRYLFQKVGQRWTVTEDGDWGNDDRLTRIVVICIREATKDAPIATSGPAPEIATR